jgi:hypothetical protein
MCEPMWTGMEEGEVPYFAFSAGLRIYGEGLDLNEITQAMGLAPTRAHRKGDRGSGGAIRRHDAWHYTVALPEDASFDVHLQALWTDVSPARDFLRSIKNKHTIDVFCGYRSNCPTAGFVLQPQSLAIFTALEIPFHVSVVII